MYVESLRKSVHLGRLYFDDQNSGTKWTILTRTKTRLLISPFVFLPEREDRHRDVPKDNLGLLFLICLPKKSKVLSHSVNNII